MIVNYTRNAELRLRFSLKGKAEYRDQSNNYTDQQESRTNFHIQ
jgi:hypothetical protein